MDLQEKEAYVRIHRKLLRPFWSGWSIHYGISLTLFYPRGWSFTWKQLTHVTLLCIHKMACFIWRSVIKKFKNEEKIRVGGILFNHTDLMRTKDGNEADSLLLSKEAMMSQRWSLARETQRVFTLLSSDDSLERLALFGVWRTGVLIPILKHHYGFFIIVCFGETHR